MSTVIQGHDTITRDALTVLHPGFDGLEPPQWVLRRLDDGLTCVALFGRNVRDAEQVAALTARLRSVRPEVIVATDEEGGDVTRLEVRTGSSFPGNLALGAVDDVDLTRAVARELGRMLAECGVTMDWAPSADVNSDPDNPVIGVRSFGSGQELVARHTAAYVRGLHDSGVIACVKHFPGHGDTATDSHHALPHIGVPLEVLRARELVPFRAAIDAGAKVVMSAHIVLSALDPTLPATLSRPVLTGLLRGPVADGGLGFDGVVTTDALEMRAIAETYGMARGAVMALSAGADALCLGFNADDELVVGLRDAIAAAVRSGELAEERLAEAASRVRGLAAWASSRASAVEGAALADPSAGAGSPVGLVAARRALTVTGASGVTPFSAPVYVASFTPVANMAAGDETPWGLVPELARLLPGTVGGYFGPSSSGAEAVAAAGERPLVAVVRDVHRHPWMGEALAAVLSARPDAVVVEMGVPQASPLGALHIATRGASRVCGVAAAEVIAGVR
ncbi:Beta-hexosaminidase [Streptomyces sp. RB5]|uniref:Beta-hexosaminidase n=1 Tax=Streptomyces smaragdinus TaxID=2585196 RepID=A0A7K0CJH2_9ACTN|nr:glycoside hydrolase family 3 N-terminal domain-containing protein [Streptomyces smaragdinus]MQY13617.1 Beta-hexosaminidase [Streptomyces smaragdinus]